MDLNLTVVGAVVVLVVTAFGILMERFDVSYLNAVSDKS